MPSAKSHILEGAVTRDLRVTVRPGWTRRLIGAAIRVMKEAPLGEAFRLYNDHHE